MCSGLRRRGSGCAGPESATPRRSINFAADGKSPATPRASPIPIPQGSAERFIYAAREANSAGRDLTLVMTPIRGKSDAIGAISLESRGTDRLALGFVLAPEIWGKGLATEAAEAMIDAAFALTRTVEILASVRVENEASQTVLGKCGFARIGTGLQGAPARGGLVECHSLPPCPRGLGRRRRAEGRSRGASRTGARSVIGGFR